MLHHIVFFSTREGEDPERLLAGLRLLEGIPTRWPVQVVRNLRFDDIGNDIEFVVYGLFEDEAALEAYKRHPLYDQSIREARPKREIRMAADFRLRNDALPPA